MHYPVRVRPFIAASNARCLAIMRGRRTSNRAGASIHHVDLLDCNASDLQYIEIAITAIVWAISNREENAKVNVVDSTRGPFCPNLTRPCQGHVNVCYGGVLLHISLQICQHDQHQGRKASQVMALTEEMPRTSDANSRTSRLVVYKLNYPVVTMPFSIQQ
jgi:hypothetical protein